MATPESKRIRLSSQDLQNTANANEEVETNVLLKIPNGVCYKNFNEMRKNEKLCDIKIIAKNGEEIWAHKDVLAANSEYFNIMFNSQFKESKELEIQIQDLDPYALSLLIDFIYTSELAVNVQNVQEILNGICLLQLNEIIHSECIDYIKSRIDPANCLGMKEMAECLGLKDFYTFCLSYALVHFSHVYKNEEFLLITFDQILQMIKSKDLCANEENVYKSVIKWIKYDLENRDKHLPDLMEYVRLPIVSQEFFESTVDKEPLLKLNNNCIKYLNEAYTVHTVFGTELEAPHSIRTQYRQNYSEHVVIMGKRAQHHLPLLFNIITNQCRTIPTVIPLNSKGETYLLDDGRLFDLGGIEGNEDYFPYPSNDSEYYNIKHDKWFKMNSLNNKYRVDYAVIALNGLIYAVGGYFEYREVKFVEQFDPKTNIWKNVAPMLHGRVAPALCALNGCMYAIGGNQYIGNHSLSLVEKYDPSTDSWEEVAKLNHARSHAGAVAVNGKIYVFGGFHSNFTIEVFCPYKNTWSVLPSTVLNSLNMYGACNAFNVKLHLKSEIFKLID
ncbi:unnamed protein product [Macrosiphum euphorbiae]|uniref:Kelch-like protein diablo n=1 Tax=Macrosiphum euphorbiae TaxID=13131 RepID=A0AAV0X2F6_9HEMI|nr:unnamed protein product [Macrosiphum euphorbiae]